MATGQLAPVLHYLRTFTAPEAARPTDPQLLDRFVADRDEAAFAALVRRHGPMVLAVCRRVLLDWHAAEDAFQATFLVLARKAKSLGSPEILGPWLHGVAHRTALKARADLARRRAREVPQTPDPPAADTTDEVIWRDLRPVLDEEVGRLPARYRVPFILCYLDGLTNAEAAQHLGCSRGTVATWLARARERLRGRLTRRGLALSAGTFAAVLSGRPASAVVPPALVAATAGAAVLSASGTLPVAGLVSPHVVPLTKGVLRAMLLTKLKFAAGSLLGAALLLLTAGVYVRSTLAEEPPMPRPVIPQLPSPPPSLLEAPSADVKGKGYFINLQIWERDPDTGNRELLSRPSVMTQEGQTAILTVGRGPGVGRDGEAVVRYDGMTAQITPTANADGTIQLKLTFEHARPTSEAEKAETGADVTFRRVETVRSVPLRVPVRISLGPQMGLARKVELLAAVVDAPQDRFTDKRAEKDLKIAEFYERTEQMQAAYFYYDLVRRRHPGTPSAEQAEKAMRRLKPLQPQPRARVGQIVIVGNTRTADTTILKQVPLVPGQAFEPHALKTAEQNLARLGLFRVEPDKGVRPTVTVFASGEDAVKDILITVQEK
jgi:RNA polymerase sigma factor (sigma-70 family)